MVANVPIQITNNASTTFQLSAGGTVVFRKAQTMHTHSPTHIAKSTKGVAHNCTKVHEYTVLDLSY